MTSEVNRTGQWRDWSCGFGHLSQYVQIATLLTILLTMTSVSAHPHLSSRQYSVDKVIYPANQILLFRNWVRTQQNQISSVLPTDFHTSSTTSPTTSSPQRPILLPQLKREDEESKSAQNSPLVEPESQKSISQSPQTDARKQLDTLSFDQERGSPRFPSISPDMNDPAKSPGPLSILQDFRRHSDFGI